MPSQSDIARDNQKGIEKANDRLKEQSQKTEDDKATRFDGNPNPDSAGSVLKPKDDTPFVIPKREEKQD